MSDAQQITNIRCVVRSAGVVYRANTLTSTPVLESAVRHVSVAYQPLRLEERACFSSLHIPTQRRMVSYIQCVLHQTPDTTLIKGWNASELLKVAGFAAKLTLWHT